MTTKHEFTKTDTTTTEDTATETRVGRLTIRVRSSVRAGSSCIRCRQQTCQTCTKTNCQTHTIKR